METLCAHLSDLSSTIHHNYRTFNMCFQLRKSLLGVTFVCFALRLASGDTVDNGTKKIKFLKKG